MEVHIVHILYLAMILLIGTLCSVLAHKLKTSNILFLVLAGMLLKIFNLIWFPKEFTITIATLALIMVVFNSTVHFKIKDILKISKEVVRLIASYFILIILLLPIFAAIFFKFNPDSGISLILLLIFSVMAFGIDPLVSLSTLGKLKNKVVDVLKFESIFNTPITLVITFTLIKFLTPSKQIGSGVFQQAFSEFIPFFMQLGVAVIVGIVIGTLVVYIMKRFFLTHLSHLALITSAIIAFVLAEVLGGNGVISVTIFGLIFGNVHIEHKLQLEKFASIFAHAITILVFILFGTELLVNLNLEALIKGTILFLIYIGIRYLSIEMALPRSKITLKQRIFMSLNVPKGIDVAVIVLILTTNFKHIIGVDLMLNLALLFVLYSIFLSTVVGVFAKDFLNIKKV